MLIALASISALRRVDGQWKIEQYHLTIPVPNELADQVVKMIRKPGA